MSVTTYEGPVFGTPEWKKYWKKKTKEEIVSAYYILDRLFREEHAEVIKLQKMVTWLAMNLRSHIDFSGDEIIEMARKASENEA